MLRPPQVLRSLLMIMPGGSVGADHVLEGGGQTKPSHKRVDGLAG
jgi:hypothetical protein